MGLAWLAPAAAFAADAVILRSTAPSTPVGLRVKSGQMLTAPEGAAVTILFRDGGIAVLNGTAEGRVRVPEVAKAEAAGELLRAAFAAPEARAVLGATRAPPIAALPPGMPNGDYVDQFLRGCKSAACKSLLDFVAETAPRSLYVRVLDADTGGPRIEARADFEAALRCWAYDPARGILPLGPFVEGFVLKSNAAAVSEGAAEALRRAHVEERFVGCTADAAAAAPDAANRAAFLAAVGAAMAATATY